VEQRVNYSQSAVFGNSSDWYEMATVRAASDSPYSLSVAVTSLQQDAAAVLEFRVTCHWLDFGKAQPGRASPPSSAVTPAAYCTSKAAY